TGLFALNQTLDFRHGPAPAEVDLLAKSLGLVIELDGSYYHLRDASAYRRGPPQEWGVEPPRRRGVACPFGRCGADTGRDFGYNTGGSGITPHLSSPARTTRMTETAVAPMTVPTTLAGELLLARLLPPAKRPPGPATVRADVARFFRAPLDDERWQD